MSDTTAEQDAGHEVLHEAVDRDQVDLSGYEPEFVVEYDGMTIAAYCIGDEYILDFSWEEGSKWEPLDEPELFAQFTDELMKRLEANINEEGTSPAEVLDFVVQGKDSES